MEKITTSTPTGKEKRIDLLDVYRGFAILGIFVVNIVIMNSTFLNQDEFAKQWTSNIDQFAERVLQLFFYTKFFPIFSLLFGLGISMQVLKLKKHNKKTFAFLSRRMLILFMIGVFHIIFIWSGDVLNLYAILGLFVSFFVSKSNKLILSLSAFFLLFPFYDGIFSFLFRKVNFNPGIFIKNYDGALVNNIISEGTYLEGIKLRLLEYISNIPMLFGFLAPIALSMFLLGIYLGKNEIYKSIKTYLRTIKKPIIIITLIANIYRIAFLFFLPGYEIYSNQNFQPYFIKLMVISDVITGLFYLWVIGWLWYYSKLKSLFKPLEYVGRMALTNYIMQSLIGLIIFSSIGFSLYEKLSPSETLLTAFAVFCLQVIYSRLWLTYFRFGPLEWIWRCLTYKKILPIRRMEKSKVPNIGYSK